MTDEKTALRAALERRRAEAARADAAEALARIGLKGLGVAPGVVVAGYVAFRSEIDPAPLLAGLAAAGVRLALPRTPPRGSPAPLTFHLWAPDSPLARGAFGVLEPLADARIVTPDVVLAPLLGFDRQGRRLGYGQGHYDRTLAALRAQRATRFIGVAYAAQEVDALPEEAHDVRLDAVLTERGLVACGR
ncbi:MAG: 5-formyltetrahydrofolate cyclo-ligase [Hyphomonadaceae bacterium]|nr:5-formyltetrahydrofolate cyclo-ligase [Hyphomonadaceae bacterium]